MIYLGDNRAADGHRETSLTPKGRSRIVEHSSGTAEKKYSERVDAGFAVQRPAVDQLSRWVDE